MKALLQQALEALESVLPPLVTPEIAKAIPAVRTAIKQAEQAQPRAWEYTATLTSGGYSSPFKERRLAFTKPEQGGPIPLYTHPQQSKPLSEAPLGAAVLVDGKTVAWFAEFTESANEWCTENYFGQWLAWRAMPPEIVPLTSEELTAVEQRAAELHEFLNIKEQS